MENKRLIVKSFHMKEFKHLSFVIYSHWRVRTFLHARFRRGKKYQETWSFDFHPVSL